ncbi:MAG: hypothetical protein NTZ74_05135 [Chloroflexi bacterium]|nr:hypothetical protein [Chloroflexota bacterium]
MIDEIYQKYKITIRNRIFVFVVFVIILTGCNLSDPLAVETPHSEEISEINDSSSLDIIALEKCWLSDNELQIGGWTKDSQQCTQLARVLTTAKGYGNNSDGTSRNGIQYVAYKGNLPLLATIKTELKVCDNLILTGTDYPYGHTAVVFHVDLPNNDVYILEQNFPTGSPILQRVLKISEIENTTYVIQESDCQQPIPTTCSIGSEDGLIIAAPDTSSQSEVSSTIEAATIQVNETEPSGLIAFIRNGNIWIYDLTTTSEKELTFEGGYSDPAISMDGSKIAFVKSNPSNNQCDVGILSISTGEIETIIQTEKAPGLPGSYYFFSNPQWTKNDSELWVNASYARVSGDETWVYTFSTSSLVSKGFIGKRDLKVSSDGEKYLYKQWTNTSPFGSGLYLINISDNTEKAINPFTEDIFIKDFCWMDNDTEITVLETSGIQEVNYKIYVEYLTNSSRIGYELEEQSDELACSNNDGSFVFNQGPEIYYYDGLYLNSLFIGSDPNIWISGK